MAGSQVENVAVGDLLPYINNAKTHPEEQVVKIAASIKEFGFNAPILADEGNQIIAGHGRLLAAKKLNMDTVPVVRLDHLSETQKKAYILADNRLGEVGGTEWDLDLVSLELEELQGMDFDLDLTGFSIDDIAPEETEGLTDEDSVPEVPEEPVSKEGDVWILGKHRLMCGNSTSIDAVEKLMDGSKADMVFTDPPYGISIVQNNQIGGGGAFGKGKEKKGGKFIEATKYAPVAGDDSIDVAVEAIEIIKTLNADVEIIWGGNYYANYLDNSTCWIVWDKETGDSTFADAELAWTNQDTKVRIFQHRWSGMCKASEHGQKRVHPTQKPIALAEWCFDNYGKECNTVLDLFGGSGFTLMACETRNKNGMIMELSPNYVDVIIKRWQEFTGKQAVHEQTSVLYNNIQTVEYKEATHG